MPTKVRIDYDCPSSGLRTLSDGRAVRYSIGIDMRDPDCLLSEAQDSGDRRPWCSAENRAAAVDEIIANTDLSAEHKQLLLCWLSETAAMS